MTGHRPAISDSFPPTAFFVSETPEDLEENEEELEIPLLLDCGHRVGIDPGWREHVFRCRSCGETARVVRG